MSRTVVIGATRRQLLPAKVSEHSIRRHATCELTVVHTYDREFPCQKDMDTANRTGFSFVRFAVPELAGYKGRALYFDSDMVIYKDVAWLFGMPMAEAAVLRPENQSAVLLYDCERLGHWRLADAMAALRAGTVAYKDLMELRHEPLARVGIPDEWNRLESWVEGRTAVLHYTRMNVQPWTCRLNPIAGRWFSALRAAIADGAVGLQEVRREVALGHVGPWVLEEAGRRRDAKAVQ